MALDAVQGLGLPSQEDLAGAVSVRVLVSQNPQRNRSGLIEREDLMPTMLVPLQVGEQEAVASPAQDLLGAEMDGLGQGFRERGLTEVEAREGDGPARRGRFVFHLERALDDHLRLLGQFVSREAHLGVA